MGKQNIYKDLARYYEIIFSWKNFKNEANVVRKLIKEYKKSKGDLLLDVACGTGKHLSYLRRYFSCTGVDLNKQMLNLARKNVSGVTFKQGNMLNFNLKKKFDIVLCLFGSIGYTRSYKNLKIALISLINHLKPKGVIIIEPWLTRKEYKPGYKKVIALETGNVSIAGLAISKLKGDLAIIDTHYLIAENDGSVKSFEDRNEVKLFEIHTILSLMKKAGLQVKFLKQSLTQARGLLVGVKL